MSEGGTGLSEAQMDFRMSMLRACEDGVNNTEVSDFFL